MNKEPAFGLASFLSEIDGVGTGVLLLLFAMSVVSWYLIAIKVYCNYRTQPLSRRFLQNFWNSSSLDAAAVTCAERPAEPYGRVSLRAFEALRHFRRVDSAVTGAAGSLTDFVARAIGRAIARESSAREFGLTMLASVGSTAPFIGLFGTVWGIYHALIAIGIGGSASLDAVAGPVGEALIMTAVGLAVAIPAVLAYNFFVRGNRVFVAELDGFAQDLHALLLTGMRPDGGSTTMQDAAATGASRTIGKARAA